MEPSEFTSEGNEDIGPAADAPATVAAAVPARRRSWLKWVVAAVATVAVIAVASTYFYFADAYTPLEIIGDGPDTSPGSLYVRTANNEFSVGPTYVYCSIANGRFAAAFEIANFGQFPVTILGGDPGPVPVTEHTNVNGFSLVDLASTRSNPGDPASGPASSETATVLPPTTLVSGNEVAVWARFQMGSLPVYGGGSISIDRIWVRYSTFGVTRTAEIPLRGQVAVTGDCAK